jgi:anti-anti-sigma factor
MDIMITLNENTCVIAINGRLDTLTAPELQAPLFDSIRQHKKTVLDFSDLEYVSSAGLRVLLMAQKSAMACTAALVIRKVSAEIREIFDMTGFSDILTVE